MRLNNKPKIKIIGSGVSGLTVAVLLLEKGYQIEILTEKMAAQTTSAKAAAIWFPYEVGPQDKANLWSKISYEIFKKYCKIPDSGVSMTDLKVLIRQEEETWWKDAIPKEAIRKADKKDLPKPYTMGYIVRVPLVETPIYLKYLIGRFRKLGGSISLGKINNLAELNTTSELIINCTGLGSRDLVNDKSMYPIYGQIVKVSPQSGINGIVSDFPFGASEEELAYVIPRRDCLILGGTIIKDREDTQTEEKITRGIITRCRDLEARLPEKLHIISVEAGLRPGRKEIRLERIGNVIHNYGHGGGGFTVSWGCAQEVEKLINFPNEK